MSIIMSAKAVVGACCFWVLAAHAADPVPREPPPEVAAQPSRQLPRLNIKAMHAPPDFRQPAAKEQTPGRVLLEFQIDHSGTAVGARILASDAAPVYQARALEVLKYFRYDVTDPGFDPSDAAPFRLTMEFCLPACRDPIYPGTNGIRIGQPGSPR
jgi:TonB family protein